MKIVASVGAFVARRPAQLGGAVTAWVAVANPSPAVTAATAATIAWIVSAYSSPKVAVEEAHQAGYNAAITDVSTLAGS